MSYFTLEKEDTSIDITEKSAKIIEKNHNLGN